MRILLDTNVVVAGLVTEGLCHELLETHLLEHTAILSTVLWNELVETLEEKFALTVDDLPFLHLYRQRAVWCDVRPLAQSVCRDPDDDWVLATALAGSADLIVTGDSDLLVLGSFQGVVILNPRQFIERLE